MTQLVDLTDHLAASRLVLFVGADLPTSLSGLPGRIELAQGLVHRRGFDRQLTLATAAQRTMQGGSRFAFTDYLIQQLNTQDKQPQRFHQIITRLPIDTIITTAYDNLLERAFEQVNVPINRVVRDSDLAFRNPRRPTLIKLYGDLSQIDTLVVTEDDHYALWRSKEALLEEIRSILRRCAVLFVGYDLTDPDFNLLWRQVLDRMGRFAIGAFAISPDMSAAERHVWAERYIHVLDMDLLMVLERLTVGVKSLPQSVQGEPNVEVGVIDRQLQLLAAYRVNLDHLLIQASQYGGERFAPLATANAIREQRYSISQLKTALRARNMQIEDRFGEESLTSEA